MRSTMRLLSGVVIAASAASCGVFPGWSAPARSAWLMGEVNGNQIVVLVEYGPGPGDCVRPDRVYVEETPTSVEIQTFLAETTRPNIECELISDWWEPVIELEAPLGDRRLTGCTYDPQGFEPAGVDCRDWP